MTFLGNKNSRIIDKLPMKVNQSFIKCFAALSDGDMDYICKYLQNELDERPVWEKRLMKVKQNYDFSEREKEALKNYLV